MQISAILIAILACWRITSLFVYEPGPWDIFSRFRDFAGLEYDEMGKVISARVKILEVLSCVWCMSIWIAFFQTGVYFLLGEQGLVLFSLPFAISMGAILLDRLV